MAGNPHSLRNGIIYILLGGVILFVAVTLGIQAGFALKGGGAAELNPENLPNRSTLKLGDPVPSLPVYTLEGETMTLSDITDGKRTVLGVVMPGCDPCKRLLTEWRSQGFLDRADDFQIVLLSASPADDYNLGPLAEFAETFTIYFCDHIPLKESCGLSTFPSIVGFGADNTVSFVANGLVYELDVEFFDEYL